MHSLDWLSRWTFLIFFPKCFMQTNGDHLWCFTNLHPFHSHRGSNLWIPPQGDMLPYTYTLSLAFGSVCSVYMEPNPTFELGPKVLLKRKNCMEHPPKHGHCYWHGHGNYCPYQAARHGKFLFGQLFHAWDVSWHAIYLIKKIISQVFRVPLICKISGVQNKKKDGRVKKICI